MSEKTQATQDMTREEVAAYFREIADAFEEEGEVSITVGNKSVTLSPPKEIHSDIEVVERSSMLRGDREAMSIDLSWKGNE